MKKYKVVCVSGMINSTLAFEALAATNQSLAVRVLGTVKPPTADEIDAVVLGVSAADLVLTGMASSPELATAELAAIGAARLAGKPFGLFADKEGVIVGRSWFAGVLPEASIVFLADGRDLADAMSAAPKATVAVPGHPKNEVAAAVNIPTRAVRDRLGLDPNTSIVFVPGTKNLAINVSVLTLVAAALRLPDFPPETVIVFGQHPGDQNDLGLYVGYGVRVVAKNLGLRGDDILPAANVFANVLSTVIDRAMYLRVPTLWIRTPEVIAHQRDKEGINLPKECAEGLVVPVETAEEFAATVAALFGERGAALRERQEALYPKPPPPGAAVALMEKTISATLDARFAETSK